MLTIGQVTKLIESKASDEALKAFKALTGAVKKDKANKYEIVFADNSGVLKFCLKDPQGVFDYKEGLQLLIRSYSSRSYITTDVMSMRKTENISVMADVMQQAKDLIFPCSKERSNKDRRKP
jgi:hypothetical protein